MKEVSNSAFRTFLLIVTTLSVVSCGSSATKLDEDFNTALARRDFEEARSLLARGADVNAKFDGGITNLHWGAAGGDPQVVRFLLDHDADRDARDRMGETPLMTAAIGGRLETARVLVEAGADPAARDLLRRSAADLARAAGHDDVVAFLEAASVARNEPATAP